MSNAARKARKRAGVPFVRVPKVGTDPLVRIEVYYRPDGIVRKVRQQLKRVARAGVGFNEADTATLIAEVG